MKEIDKYIVFTRNEAGLQQISSPVEKYRDAEDVVSTLSPYGKNTAIILATVKDRNENDYGT